MSEFFIGQVMISGFNFAPRGFAQCNGQILPIAQNQALFSLLGTQYGGNGTTNFALPNLKSRTPIGSGNSVDPGWNPSPASIGQVGGVENVTLLSTNLPSHTHTLQATTATGTTRIPKGNALASSASTAIYGAAQTTVSLSQQSVAQTGNTQPHSNLQPYLTLNFCIALLGIFPSRD
ncbi:phage tail protein [Comamonas sp. 4034]|uniref:phage tail protein n=1 Tax=Comamonas sp. 4034 TaxID=3156455 RepID=UPI003D205C8F